MLIAPQQSADAVTSSSSSSATGQQPAALPPGTVLSHYRIDALLAASEFGFVYRASDTLLLRHVAIKEYFPQSLGLRSAGNAVVPQSAANAPALTAGREAFMQEARLLSRFNHPSLVHVLDAFEAHQTAYRVMPFFDGRTLEQAVAARAHPANAGWVTDLLLQLLDPLEMLHAAGLVHGCLHPGQIMLQDGGQVLLLGFGAVRRSLNVPADAAYAAPDQGMAAGSSPRGSWTDLYSLGALAWFAATGHPPPRLDQRQTAQGAAGIASTVGAALEPRDGAGRDREKAALLSTIERALSTQPMQRLRSVAEFRMSLTAAAEASMAPSAAMEPIAAAMPRQEAPPPSMQAAAARDASAAPAPAAAARKEPKRLDSDSALPPSAEEIDPAARDLIAKLVSSIPDPEPHWTPPPIPGPQEQEWAERMAMGQSAKLQRRAAQRRATWIGTVVALMIVAVAAVAAWRWDDVREGAMQMAEFTGLVPPRNHTAAPGTGDTAEAPTAPIAAAPTAAGHGAAPSTPPPPEAGMPQAAANPPANAASAAPAPTPPQGPAYAPPVAQQQQRTPAPLESQPQPSRYGAAPASPSVPAQPRAEAAVPQTAPGETVVPPAAGSRVAQAQPAQAPAATPRKHLSPRDLCAGRSNFSLYYCMQAQCRKPEFETHGQCQEMRRTGDVN